MVPGLSRPHLGCLASAQVFSALALGQLHFPARPRAFFFQPSPSAQSRPCLRSCSGHHHDSPLGGGEGWGSQAEILEAPGGGSRPEL